MSPSSPIVVLDSGLGGLTVARAIRAALPREDLVYFGDTARVPYGGKTGPTIIAFMRQIILYLQEMDAKQIVIACNTATALALQPIKREFRQIPISGVIEPGARAAAFAAGNKEYPVIGVIGTDATIRSGAYERALLRRRHRARVVCHATPLLAPIIEEGRTSADPLVRLALEQYLRPLLDHAPDVLVLGCTHYPILKDAIAQIAGPGVRVIDSAEQCAQDVAVRLRSGGMLYGGDRCGRMRCFVTDDSPRFAAMASRFLGFQIAPPAWVPPEELYRIEADALAARSGRLPRFEGDGPGGTLRVA